MPISLDLISFNTGEHFKWFTWQGQRLFKGLYHIFLANHMMAHFPLTFLPTFVLLSTNFHSELIALHFTIWLHFQQFPSMLSYQSNFSSSPVYSYVPMWVAQMSIPTSDLHLHEDTTMITNSIIYNTIVATMTSCIISLLIWAETEYLNLLHSQTTNHSLIPILSLLWSDLSQLKLANWMQMLSSQLPWVLQLCEHVSWSLPLFLCSEKVIQLPLSTCMHGWLTYLLLIH